MFLTGPTREIKVSSVNCHQRERGLGIARSGPRYEITTKCQQIEENEPLVGSFISFKSCVSALELDTSKDLKSKHSTLFQL